MWPPTTFEKGKGDGSYVVETNRYAGIIIKQGASDEGVSLNQVQ
jgi:hypothetical protein